MILLEMVEEFQKDIAVMRLKLGIPERGIRPDTERYLDEREAVLKARDEAVKILYRLGNFSPAAKQIRPNEKPRTFQIEVTRIGEKYRLPYNLYYRGLSGIAWYALTNEVCVPMDNWEIGFDTGNPNRPLVHRWATIKVFAPLDEKEAANAVVALNEALRRSLPQALVAPRKVKKGLEKNLQQVVMLIEKRKQRGKGRTYYLRGSYLDRITKNPTITKKEMRILEKKNPHSIAPREPLSERDKGLLKRANHLAKEIFGYGILPSKNRGR